MKKLFAFIKAKENEEKIAPSNKKASSDKTTKVLAPPPTNNVPPRELYSDGYSDVGYC